jgi:hypothetical protein
MRPNTVQLDGNAGARASIAIATLLLAIGLAGCAAELRGRPDNSADDGTPYVGVFTGEYVDGKPLYRLPPIHVVGSRKSLGDT